MGGHEANPIPNFPCVQNWEGVRQLLISSRYLTITFLQYLVFIGFSNLIALPGTIVS